MELGEVMSFPELRQQRKPHASNLVGTALQTQLVPKQQLKSGKAAEQLVSWSRSFVPSALWKRDHGDMEKTTSAWQKWAHKTARTQECCRPSFPQTKPRAGQSWASSSPPGLLPGSWWPLKWPLYVPGWSHPTPTHLGQTSIREKQSRLSWMRASDRPIYHAACDISEHPFITVL